MRRAAGLLGAALLAALTLGGVPATSSPAAASPASSARAADQPDVFVGTVASVTASVTGGGGTRRVTTHVYTIAVRSVYRGDVGQRELVSTTRAFESCRGADLDDTGKTDYAFQADADDGRYVVRACSAVKPFTTALGTLLEESGLEPTDPGGPDASPDEEFPPVEFFSNLADEPESFTRTAAPGLALVIVGLLGLLVARRVGRR